jgi:hypothetical protein
VIRPHTEDLIQEVALQLRASLFFFHPSSIEFIQSRSVAVITGAIYCRVDLQSVPFQELFALTKGFDTPGPFIPTSTWDGQSKSLVRLALQHDTEYPDKKIELRVKFKDGFSTPIDGFPTLFKVSITYFMLGSATYSRNRNLKCCSVRLECSTAN